MSLLSILRLLGGALSGLSGLCWRRCLALLRRLALLAAEDTANSAADTAERLTESLTKSLAESTHCLAGSLAESAHCVTDATHYVAGAVRQTANGATCAALLSGLLHGLLWLLGSRLLHGLLWLYWLLSRRGTLRRLLLEGLLLDRLLLRHGLLWLLR